MSIFSTVDVMGPAHRDNMVRSLADNAAQAVLRRQRLRAILAQHGAGGQGPGGGIQFRGSMMHQATGTRGSVSNPGITQSQLAAMMAAAGRPGFSPLGRFGGMTNPSGGGYDFGAVPSSDPHQSPASTGQPQFRPGPPLPGGGPGAGIPGLPASGGIPAGINPGGPNQPYTGGGGVMPSAPSTGGGAIMPNPNSAVGGAVLANAIPLGGNLFYDPVTDTVVGGSAGATGGIVGGGRVTY